MKLLNGNAFFCGRKIEIGIETYRQNKWYKIKDGL